MQGGCVKLLYRLSKANVNLGHVLVSDYIDEIARIIAERLYGKNVREMLMVLHELHDVVGVLVCAPGHKQHGHARKSWKL